MTLMRQRWQQLVESFGQLPRERRVLIAVAIWLLVSLPLLSYQLLPEWQRHLQQQQQQRQIAQQMAQQQQAISQLQQQLQADVNKPVQEQIARQQARLDDLQQVSESYILLDKRQRQAFLESSLAYPDAIELVSLISELPEPLDSESENVNLYQHQINASYRGNYTDLRLFFKQLREQHPDVRWHQFNYQVLTYPQAQVELTWQLLSTDKEIIGG